ncbi:MAG: ribosome assembly cofactor RimP [Ghiorsea sp.]
MADIETVIKELAEPIVEELDVDFMGVVLSGSSDNRLVRVVVDKKGGVGVEALRRLSKGLSLQLDAEDLIAGKYHLEISSPGLEWPLTTAKDFERYENEWLRIMFEDGRRILEGDNLGLDDTGDILILGVRGEPKEVVLSETRKVVRSVNWGKVSGKGKRGKSNAKKKK